MLSSLIPFTIPPFVCAVRWSPADGSAQHTLKIHTQELELTRLDILTKRLSKGHDRSLPFGDVPAPSARDRRNVSSLARGPNSAAASLQSAVASTCGHSSSQRSAVGFDRRRRSCVTIASCHATSRARSDTASAVSVPKLSIAYGFISKSPRATYTCRVLFEQRLIRERSVVAVRSPTCSGWPLQVSESDWTDDCRLTNGRVYRRCRCREALARIAASDQDVVHRSSHFRHRLYGGWRRTMESRTAT